MTTPNATVTKTFSTISEDDFGGTFVSSKNYKINNVDFPLIYINTDFDFSNNDETIKSYDNCVNAIKFFSENIASPFVLFNYAYHQYILVADGHYKILNHFGGPFEYPTVSLNN